jgi:hypothetical protein
MGARGLVVLVGGLLVVALLVGAIADGGDGPAVDRVATPEPGHEPPRHHAADRARDPEGNHRGEPKEGRYLPEAQGKSTAAGDPEQVARAFATAWINRPSDPARLRRQNHRLVALSRGFWADQIAATLKTEAGSGARGTVVGVEFLRDRPDSSEALVTTREQLAPDGKAAEPYHYGLYLVRMEPVDGEFAVSSWEPQF